MSKQHELFEKWRDVEAAGKEAGMSQVDENADEAWKESFDAALIATACRMASLTSRDVLAALESNGTRTHDLRAVGPRMLVAAKSGTIAATNEYRNTGSHQRPQRVWRSLVYRG